MLPRSDSCYNNNVIPNRLSENICKKPIVRSKMFRCNNDYCTDSDASCRLVTISRNKYNVHQTFKYTVLYMKDRMQFV